jgi:hypothetical protein
VSYANPIMKALTETEELAVLLDADLDLVNGGFSWWHGHGLDLGVHTEITGWLVGLVFAVETNLRGAATHLTDYREARYADDRWILQRAKNGGVPNLHRSNFEARREARINAHRAGILRTAGSILDTLAGVVVGVGGLDTDLPKSDLGKRSPSLRAWAILAPRFKATSTSHKMFCDLVIDEANSSGPYARHFSTLGQPVGWTTPKCMASALPQIPPSSSSKKTPSSPLTGVLESINAAVVGVVLACKDTWLYRRSHPGELPQPSTQWPIRPLRTTPFAGYDPQPRKAAPNESFAVATRTGRVLRATKVLDGDHP